MRSYNPVQRPFDVHNVLRKNHMFNDKEKNIHTNIIPHEELLGEKLAGLKAMLENHLDRLTKAARSAK